MDKVLKYDENNQVHFYHQTVVQGGDERSTNIIMYFFTLARAHDC